jgi:hypothetical protein
VDEDHQENYTILGGSILALKKKNLALKVFQECGIVHLLSPLTLLLVMALNFKYHCGCAHQNVSLT